MRIDLTKKTKGLPLLTVLFSDTTKIYETDCFIDAYTKVDFLPCLNNHIFLLYEYNFYDEYIKKLLRENKNFLYEYTVCYENKMYYMFIFTVKDKLMFESMLSVGAKLMGRLFFSMLVIWKEYLTEDFYSYHDTESCKNVLKMKGAAYFQVAPFLLLF